MTTKWLTFSWLYQLLRQKYNLFLYILILLFYILMFTEKIKRINKCFKSQKILPPCVQRRFVICPLYILKNFKGLAIECQIKSPNTLPLPLASSK